MREFVIRFGLELAFLLAFVLMVSLFCGMFVLGTKTEYGI